MDGVIKRIWCFLFEPKSYVYFELLLLRCLNWGIGPWDTPFPSVSSYSHFFTKIIFCSKVGMLCLILIKIMQYFSVYTIKVPKWNCTPPTAMSLPRFNVERLTLSIFFIPRSRSDVKIITIRGKN